MAKLRPYGIETQVQEEPHLKIIPDRVQKLIDLYHKNHTEYVWTEEDRSEQLFEYRRGLRSDTYKYNISSIYRVRDLGDKSKEYYFYYKKGSVLNDSNETEQSLTHTYGFAVELEHKLKWNRNLKANEPIRIRDNPTYYYEWSKDEVKKVLDGSQRPCLNYYVGVAGSTGQGGSAPTNILAVQDVTDFLDGDFEDLVILNKSGMMNPFGPSLPLVKKARKKLEDKALEKIEDSVNK